ncbi:unnamed protein product [Heterobilharzia americana]|nr:unnamed protein product [Heterobilharzia americana]
MTISNNIEDAKREKLVERVRISVVVFWILSIIFLIIGITVLSMYHNLNESSQYPGTVAGTFFLVSSVPLIICSGCLTSALLIIQESIQDERDYRCRDPEFYKDIPYPRQPFKPVQSSSLSPMSYPSAPPVPIFETDQSKIFQSTNQYGSFHPPSYHTAVTPIN